VSCTTKQRRHKKNADDVPQDSFSVEELIIKLNKEISKVSELNKRIKVQTECVHEEMRGAETLRKENQTLFNERKTLEKKMESIERSFKERMYPTVLIAEIGWRVITTDY
jgi:predicted  nucleic acid-binding Zn-ribbon protein